MSWQRNLQEETILLKCDAQYCQASVVIPELSDGFFTHKEIKQELKKLEWRIDLLNEMIKKGNEI